MALQLPREHEAAERGGTQQAEAAHVKPGHCIIVYWP